ncbi:hypothetical protein BJV78DRAFT_65611 [Lactifluus subvellereus]|nr:hypothetical protein BJV78DRAFT_65611 [Lactifluus subvellereus]
MCMFHTLVVLGPSLLNLLLARSSHELAPRRLNLNQLSSRDFWPFLYPYKCTSILSEYRSPRALLLLYQIALRILFYTLCTHHLLENCFITCSLWSQNYSGSQPDV